MMTTMENTRFKTISIEVAKSPIIEQPIADGQSNFYLSGSSSVNVGEQPSSSGAGSV